MNKKTKRILYWVTVTFLSLVILVSAVLIARKLINDYRDKQEYDRLVSIMESERLEAERATTEPTLETTDPTKEPTVPPETTVPTILAEYQELYDMNNDMVGWIEIEGTNINYPVVQSPYEANYYLERNFNKEYAKCGAIYAREACDVDKPSDNITLYGHNMANGTMFGQIHDYKKQSFYEEHKYIRFDTLYEHHTYEIFALFLISAGEDEPFKYHVFDDAKDEADFNSFVSNCISRAFYDTGIVPEYGDKLITLSTCDRSITDGRLVLVARLIE